MKNFLPVIFSFFCGILYAQQILSPVAPVLDSNAVVTMTTNDFDLASSIASGYVLDDKHKLAPGDKVSFQILEDKDPPKSLTVTDSGELEVPYIGRVVVANKTCKQIAEEVKVPLEKDYYYRATVVIGLDVVNKVSGKVYVVGQVHLQGPIEIPSEENFTVGKAILRAGGFGDFADKKNVLLVHTDPDGKKQTFQLNMVDVLEKGETEKDKPLQEGDFIIVPSRLINF
jgi:protein involved in polysaccharide export with SLBB domain